MIPGLRGSLLSADALEKVVPIALRDLLDETNQQAARRRLRAWHLPLREQLGPATAARTAFDRLAVPLFCQLGYRVVPSPEIHDATAPGAPLFRATLQASGAPAAVLIVTGWGQDAAHAWREAVHQGIGRNVRWCVCVTGPALRIFDSRRTYSRRYLELDLNLALDDEHAFRVFWGLLRAGAMRPPDTDARPLLDRAVDLSEQHRVEVRNSLQHGVHEALIHLVHTFTTAVGRRFHGRPTAPEGLHTYEEALIIVYRILFLLFAEARGMVPNWHPVFRDGYTIEALRGTIETVPNPRGLWEALQALARLAHRGCRIGALRVPPFNGRLFSPAHSPLADTLPLDDRVVRQALRALTTRAGPGGRERIAYGDLGVEQLGGVYERLLDVEPSQPTVGRRPVLVRAERRKTTGSFYTPRSITEYVVRRTLAPLVHDASPERILALRVLDPAMGSGAFLVAACRYLASAYEAAILRADGLSATEIGDPERAGFRRTIAQQCLYGVDLNPMAVQLGRLSLWLATLAADRPLTFLDHRLRTGNSLVGAGLADIARQPPPGRRRLRRPVLTPLFDDHALDAAVRDAVGVREAIASEPGDTLDQVRSKERALDRLSDQHSSVAKWKAVVDLWCSGWFRDRSTRRLSHAFSALADSLLGGDSGLPEHTVRELLAESREIAARERFFHWSLEFPEVFFDADGAPLKTPGFDAVVGNPPWEMLRGDRGAAPLRDSTRVAASRLTEFARESGVYRFQSAGHANLYQLFLDRALALVREEGRLGILLPAGFATDHGGAALRRAVFDRTTVDSFVSFENRDGVFPIHRGLKFLLVTAARHGRTTTLPCRFGIRRPESLDALPETGLDSAAVLLSRPLLERVGGPELAIPDLRSRRDVELVSAATFGFPALGDRDGWNVRFGRELNATDDRRHFTERDGLPVIEGKLIAPFTVHVARARSRIPFVVAARLLDPARTFQRARLAYRDVAAATNRRTLIAAIVPPGVVTTHTLFCLKDALDDESQRYLCGMLNSFVADYLVRLRVTTHVNVSIIERLPVPRPSAESRAFREVASLSAALGKSPADGMAAARLHACAACLYGLRRDQFQHVLDTFPLVPEPQRTAAMQAFCDIVP